MHYFTKYGFGEVYFSDQAIDDRDEQQESGEEDSPRVTPNSSPVTARKVTKDGI